MKQIELKDFLDFKYLSNLKLSPSATSAVYALSKANEKDNVYDTNLHMIRDGKDITLTNTKEQSFIYLDDETILFQSVRTKEGKQKQEAGEEYSEFHTLSLLGGEAMYSFSVPYTVVGMKLVNNDALILQVYYDDTYSSDNPKKQKELAAKKKANADYEVFQEIPFYMNNGGFTSGKFQKLYAYDLKKKKATPLTTNDMDVSIMDCKENKILCLYAKRQVKPSLKEGIMEIDINTNEINVLLEEKDYSIYCAYYYQQQVLVVANKDVRYGNNDNPSFYMLDLTKKKIHLYIENEYSFGNTVGTDARLGGGQICKVVDDKFYFLSTREDSCHIYCLDENKEITLCYKANGSFDCFDVVNGKLYAIAMLDNKLQEVYSVEDSYKQLTKQNTSLHNKYLADYNEVTFHNDGSEFKGWVLLPRDYDEKKQYPAILDIHGGPKTVYGKVYYHEMQVWANKGYFVFFTNPRGACGRDSAFANIYGHYGEKDYEDLMLFSDTVLKKYPQIDRKRVGVTGGSYGGFMTNWIISHTDRFKVAATQRSISNWISFFGTSDIGFHFTEDQTHGNIYNDYETLWKQSPLKYVSNVVTPTLIIHSDEDYRCPLEQGMQWYTALCDRQVEAKMVVFKGENHELSRSGLPKHRIRRLEEITNWMDDYLQP